MSNMWIYAGKYCWKPSSSGMLRIPVHTSCCWGVRLTLCWTTSMLYWALFDAKAPYNKLWLSLDKRAILDLRLTKYLILLSCSFILLLNGLQNRFRLPATTKTRVSFYSKPIVRPYLNQATVDTSSNVDPSNQIWTPCLKCLRTKQLFQNYFVLTCVNVDRDSLTFKCCHIILCRFEKNMKSSPISVNFLVLTNTC